MQWTALGDNLRTPGSPLVDLFASAESSAAFVPLRALNDKYAICEVLYGGMGEVMICRLSAPAARGVHSDIALALKTFQRKFFFQSDIRAAFDKETELWSRLCGVPHIM